MIHFNCSLCHQAFKVEDKSAGKKTKCPKCGTALLVPSPSPPSVSGPAAADTFGVLDELPVAAATPKEDDLFDSFDQQPAFGRQISTTRPRNKRKSQRPIFVYAAFAGMLLVTVTVVVTLLVSRNVANDKGPTPDGVGGTQGDAALEKLKIMLDAWKSGDSILDFHKDHPDISILDSDYSLGRIILLRYEIGKRRNDLIKVTAVFQSKMGTELTEYKTYRIEPPETNAMKWTIWDWHD
jgi:DNA-directed RNA polymerase subunit RPC12/RpoP